MIRTQILLVLAFIALGIEGNVSCFYSDDGSRITLQNDYMLVSMNLISPSVDTILANTLGTPGQWSKNLATNVTIGINQTGIALERDSYDDDGLWWSTSSSQYYLSKPLEITVLTNSTSFCSFQTAYFPDSIDFVIVEASWTLSLGGNDRFFSLTSDTRAANTSTVTSVRLASYFTPLATYGLFERGIAQMMLQSSGSMMFSNDTLVQYYALGGGCVNVKTNSTYEQTILLSGAANDYATSGILFGLVGSYSETDMWVEPTWENMPDIQLTAGETLNTMHLEIYPNDFDFPLSPVKSLDTNMDFDNVRTIYTAVYASSVGCLVSYYSESQGEESPTLAFPTHAYSPLYNFFDPDSFFTIQSFMFSGDTYLFNEARKLLEKNAGAMLSTGQFPHHFSENTPIYDAISGATQTGPNAFWIMSALTYARVSGNYTWLEDHYDYIEPAVGYITNLYNFEFNLVNAPGSLWIDVFIRNNFTSDTNAFMVYLLTAVADAEIFLGKTSQAALRMEMINNITIAMNKYLWDDESNDHYMTQRNPDMTTRDFVDYDSNLLAVAFGIPSDEQALAVLKRVDSGNCTHARPTWVSEKFYGPTDCYNGNIGDSAVTMGRIGWADGLARKRMNDLTTYTEKIIQPVMGDLFKFTWLYERYTCEAQFTHNPYYHEYPEMLVMLLTSASYGIEIGFNNITIDSFAYGEFSYRVADFSIEFTSQNVSMSNISGAGSKGFIIHNLEPSSQYSLAYTSEDGASSSTVSTNSEGVAYFEAAVGIGSKVDLLYLS